MNRTYWRIIYLAVGAASLLFFSWTGQYLHATYPDKRSMEMGFRVMLRSRHLFILLVSLLEIGIGIYIRPTSRLMFRYVQSLSTGLLLIAHGLFIWAFFYEVDTHTIPQTPVVYWATYSLLTSSLLHSSVLFDRQPLSAC